MHSAERTKSDHICSQMCFMLKIEEGSLGLKNSGKNLRSAEKILNGSALVSALILQTIFFGSVRDSVPRTSAS